ncbi:MAG: 3-hydroxybutyryl-CoA dehydrogenase [Candidatus Marinimicrobia bacterium]|nr:3-hydroxybutyryl-CoA dehydrogenase [Candidatus Neomarinimicrobiota bacterium]
MGHGIAQVGAQAGLQVILVDVGDELLRAAMSSIEANLARQVAKDALTQTAADATLGRIRTAPQLAEVKEVQIVVEAVSENADLKRDIFRQLDDATPAGTVLASNTSSISITLLGAATERPDRVIGMHFMNPVPVMPLVEVVRGQETSDDTHAAVVVLAEALGKTPVTVNDFPGFVSNRLLMPMINEAAFCLLEGVAEKEAIDEIMQLGMNHPMGPLALADLIGLDTCLSVMEVLHRELGEDKYRPCPLLRRMVAAGALGRKAGRGFYDYRSARPASGK